MSLHLGKPRPSVEYYPNNIGNLAIGTPRSYAFLILGRDDRGIQVQILNSLLKRGARIVSQTGYVDEKTREFTLCVSCDIGEVSVTPDDLVIELRRMKQVRNAMAICLKNRMFDGFLFPLTILLTNRVVSIDSNITFLIQERLNTEESKAALRDVGRDYALDIVKQVRTKMSSGFPEDAIQENVRGYLKAAGWGSFSWQSETTFERVVVIDPPIFSGKAVGNYFLHGMAAGLVESFRKKKFMLAEEVYKQDTRSLALMLSELRIEVKRLESPGEKKISKSVEVRALEEVEKVIRSVELDEMEIETTHTTKDQSKPVVLIQQSGISDIEEKQLEPVKEAVRPVPVEAPKKAEAPPIEPEVMKEMMPPPVEALKEEIRPTVEVEVPKNEIKPLPEEKKPLRVIAIKGIKEKEEDDEDDLGSNELWFEELSKE